MERLNLQPSTWRDWQGQGKAAHSNTEVNDVTSHEHQRARHLPVVLKRKLGLRVANQAQVTRRRSDAQARPRSEAAR